MIGLNPISQTMQYVSINNSLFQLIALRKDNAAQETLDYQRGNNTKHFR